MTDKKTTKKARNILLVLAIMLLLPLTWHAVAPISCCWMQGGQLAACGFCAAMFGFLAGALTLEM